MTLIKVIYDSQKNTIRCTDFSSKEFYQLNAIKFYFPKTSLLIDRFCILKTKSGSTILKLAPLQGEYNKSYEIYSVSLDNSIIDDLDSFAKLSIMLVNETSNYVSNEITLNLLYDSFQLAEKDYRIREISAQAAEYYNKISELTKLNIQLYSDIKEVTKE